MKPVRLSKPMNMLPDGIALSVTIIKSLIYRILSKITAQDYITGNYNGIEVFTLFVDKISLLFSIKKGFN